MNDNIPIEGHWLDQALRIRPQFAGTLICAQGRLPSLFAMRPAHSKYLGEIEDPWHCGMKIYRWELNAEIELDSWSPGFEKFFGWINPDNILNGKNLTAVADEQRIADSSGLGGGWIFNAFVLRVHGITMNVRAPNRGKVAFAILLSTTGAPFSVPSGLDVAEVMAFEHGLLFGHHWCGYHDWCLEHDWPERAEALAKGGL